MRNLHLSLADRVASRQRERNKIKLDSVRAVFNTSVWLQAGQCLALAAQIPAKQKSGCRPLRQGGGGAGGALHLHRPCA
jgi:hypothetical protein